MLAKGSLILGHFASWGGNYHGLLLRRYVSILRLGVLKRYMFRPSKYLCIRVLGC
jgi:hypothetical protein